MDKEVLLALIAKDINELQMMAGNIAELAGAGNPFFKLMLGKAQTLADNLQTIIEMPEPQCEEKPEPVATAQIPVLDLQAVESLISELEQRMQLRFNEAVETIQGVARTIEDIDLRQSVINENQNVEFIGNEGIAGIPAIESDVLEEKKNQTCVAAPAELVEPSELLKPESSEDKQSANAEPDPVYYPVDDDEEEVSVGELRVVDNNIERNEVSESEENKDVEYQSEAEPSVLDENGAASKQESLNEHFSAPETIVDKLARQQEGVSIGVTINNQKIDDLKAAITIADRFRFQRELFGGDGERMNKTISELNVLKSIDEAENYIEKNFSWTPESQAAADFIKLLHRRF